MSKDWTTLKGIVVRGHQVASTGSEHYPKGTIEMQIPFFKDRGLDLTQYYRGTLNISIEPNTFKVKNAEHLFRNVEWTPKHPPEDFSFSRCRIIFNNAKYEGWVYYPHPETKIRHHQNDSLIEVIALDIPDITYGVNIELEVKAAEIEITRTAH